MNNSRKRMWNVALVATALLAVALQVTGCLSSDTASLTPTPTKTPRPSDARMPALPTSSSTPTPSTTPTSVASPTPTAVPSSPTPTPEPTLPALGEAWPTLAPDLCPLTGLEVGDSALLERRPLAVKVQNAAISRPQYGIPLADIVYEHLTEAGITRFTAIYLCQDVEKIGSTRSARFIDLEIPAMYKSLLAFSGTSAGLYPKFLNADFYDREFCYGWGLHASAFYRDMELVDQGIPIEHTLFADPDKIWEIADELDINQPQELRAMHFSQDAPEGGMPATHINIPFPSSDMIVDYRYDPELGAYLRWNAGESHVDGATGEQFAVTNVILVYATHVDTDIFEDEPRRNHPSVQIQLWGTGPAVIFRDGQAFEGLWARPQRDDMLVFRDPTGQIPVPLKPGNIWIELVPLEGHRWAFEATWDAGE